MKIQQRKNKIVMTNVTSEEKDEVKELVESISQGKVDNYNFTQRNEAILTFSTDEDARLFLNKVSQKEFKDKVINSKNISLPKEKSMIAYCDAENVFSSLQEGNPN